MNILEGRMDQVDRRVEEAEDRRVEEDRQIRIHRFPDMDLRQALVFKVDLVSILATIQEAQEDLVSIQATIQEAQEDLVLPGLVLRMDQVEIVDQTSAGSLLQPGLLEVRANPRTEGGFGNWEDGRD
jgi:hypothetical protein